GFAGALGEPLEVSLQVRPANLAEAILHGGVDVPAVGRDHPLHLAEQGREAVATATLVADEEGESRRRGDPEPRFLAGLPPAGLVDVLARGLANGLPDFLVRLGESVGDLSLELACGAQRDGNPEHLLEELLRDPAHISRGIPRVP